MIIECSTIARSPQFSMKSYNFFMDHLVWCGLSIMVYLAIWYSIKYMSDTTLVIVSIRVGCLELRVAQGFTSYRKPFAGQVVWGQRLVLHHVYSLSSGNRPCNKLFEFISRAGCHDLCHDLRKISPARCRSLLSISRFLNLLQKGSTPFNWPCNWEAQTLQCSRRDDRCWYLSQFKGCTVNLWTQLCSLDDQSRLYPYLSQAEEDRGRIILFIQ